MQEVTNAVFQMRFPQKLWYLLNLRTDAILWGGTGRTILLNYRILHNYLQCDHSIFKTTNISSFVRQLNLYGFRKVTSHLQDPLCNSSNPYMHEYVHDYFQFGRPELLKKITRKALTMKRCFKPKNLYINSDQYYTPLQKARRVLRIALNKAAQDLFIQNSPKQNINVEYEDATDEFCEDEDKVELDWLISKNSTNDDPIAVPKPDLETNIRQLQDVGADNIRDSAQDNIMNFSDDSCQQTSDNFPAQFLSMPELDGVTNENAGVELLAEFDIASSANEDTIVKHSEKRNECNSLNCVLPSISSDHIDDVSMTEKNNEDHYNGEWDQMFNDIMTNRSSNQEGVSNLKELYSQISLTIDLLNS